MIVDSSALVAVLSDEPAASRLNRAIADAGVVMVASPSLVETGMVVGSRLGTAGLALLDEYLARVEARGSSASPRRTPGSRRTPSCATARGGTRRG